jgi:hypothetical protein
MKAHKLNRTHLSIKKKKKTRPQLWPTTRDNSIMNIPLTLGNKVSIGQINYHGHLFSEQKAFLLGFSLILGFQRGWGCLASICVVAFLFE